MYNTFATYLARLSKAQMASLIILLFVLWALISWQWYVCGVRDLCTTSTPTVRITIPTAEATEATPSPLVEEPSCTPILYYSVGFTGKNNPDDIRRLARFMNTTQGERLALDGIFGPSDHAAIVTYQIRHGLPRTGTVDEPLREVINREACTPLTTN